MSEYVTVFNFEVAHGYEIWRGYVAAKDKEAATEKILSRDWDDIIDEFETENFIEGFEIIDIW